MESNFTIERLDQHWLKRVTLRPARESDLPALEWNGQYRHLRLVYTAAFERVQAGTGLIWLADLPEIGILGQLFVQLISDRFELADGRRRAYIYSFRIKPDFQNRGLGTCMLLHAENDLVQRGFTFATLNVAKNNPRALQLYIRLGYEIAAHEPGIWSFQDDQGEWETVEEPSWRMKKKLTSMR